MLPEARVDRILAQVHLADDVTRAEEERKTVRQQLQRLGQIYSDGLVILDHYRRRKQARSGSRVQMELAAVSQDRMRTSPALRIRRFL